jgi:hypothetical protein
MPNLQLELKTHFYCLLSENDSSDPPRSSQVESSYNLAEGLFLLLLFTRGFLLEVK